MHIKIQKTVVRFFILLGLTQAPSVSTAQLHITTSNDLYITANEVINYDGITFTPNTAVSFPATTLTVTREFLSNSLTTNPHLKKYYSFSTPITNYSGMVAIDHSDVTPKVDQYNTTFPSTTDLRLNINNGTIWFMPTNGNTTASLVEGTSITNATMATFAVAAVTAPLPVTLVSFSGKLYNNGVLLQWVTANETNSSHFDVERSGNGTSFAKINSVKAAGYSSSIKNYQYLDETPLPKKSWYRLKQVDLDGKFTYTSVLPIERDAKISSYPNPVSNQLQLQLSQDWKGNYDMIILDMSGKLIMKNQVKSGSYIFDCSNWASGIYHILLYQDSQQVYEQKIFKK